MEIHVTRIAKQANYTIGRLSIVYPEPVRKVVDGEYVTETMRYFCDTLEPTYRDLKKVGKVPGRTAIPCGRYQILVTKSYRFNCWLPLLLNVPGFQGIRIHPGNYPEDTRGCILVGMNKRKGMVIQSRATMHNLMYEINGALDRNEQIWITITNVYPSQNPSK